MTTEDVEGIDTLVAVGRGDDGGEVACHGLWTMHVRSFTLSLNAQRVP